MDALYYSNLESEDYMHLSNVELGKVWPICKYGFKCYYTDCFNDNLDVEHHGMQEVDSDHKVLMDHEFLIRNSLNASSNGYTNHYIAENNDMNINTTGSEAIYCLQEQDSLTENFYVFSELFKLDEIQYLQLRSGTSILDTHYLLDQIALVAKHDIDNQCHLKNLKLLHIKGSSTSEEKLLNLFMFYHISSWQFEDKLSLLISSALLEISKSELNNTEANQFIAKFLHKARFAFIYDVVANSMDLSHDVMHSLTTTSSDLLHSVVKVSFITYVTNKIIGTGNTDDTQNNLLFDAWRTIIKVVISYKVASSFSLNHYTTKVAIDIATYMPVKAYEHMIKPISIKELLHDSVKFLCVILVSEKVLISLNLDKVKDNKMYYIFASVLVRQVYHNLINQIYSIIDIKSH